MNLSEYISGTLLQIASGVADAEERQDEYGAVFVPGLNINNRISHVNFSISVAAGKEGSADLRVVSADCTSTVVQKIEFGVDVARRSGNMTDKWKPERKSIDDNSFSYRLDKSTQPTENQATIAAAQAAISEE